MKIIDMGHKYKLSDNKSDSESTTLIFFKDAAINGSGYNGTTNQEVLRALIDRMKFLDNQVKSKFNREIIYHLRMAIILHEERHLNRLVERGEAIELIEPGSTGHYV